MPSKSTNCKKACGSCKKIKPVGEFVTLAGDPNPRGKYCGECFDAREYRELLRMFEGRDTCPYCGRQFQRSYEKLPSGIFRNLLERDHMDPIAWGGDLDEEAGMDSEGQVTITGKNTIYCCRECNQRKGDMLFADWLQTLRPPNRELARAIYIRKHGRSPEAFKPERVINGYMTWTITAEDDDQEPKS